MNKTKATAVMVVAFFILLCTIVFQIRQGVKTFVKFFFSRTAVRVLKNKYVEKKRDIYNFENF